MFQTIIAVLLIASVSTFSKAHSAATPTSLTNATILPADDAKLASLGNAKDMRELLDRIGEEFPEIRIVVMPWKIDDASAGITIQWLDRKTKDLTETFFYQDQANVIAGPTDHGMFLEPQRILGNLIGRPLFENAVLLIASNAGRTVVFHELIHYLFFRARFDAYRKSHGDVTVERFVYANFSPQIEQMRLTQELEKLAPSDVTTKIKLGARREFLKLEILERHRGEEVDVVRALEKRQKILRLPLNEMQKQFRYGIENATVIRDFTTSKLGMTSARESQSQAPTHPGLREAFAKAEDLRTRAVEAIHALQFADRSAVAPIRTCQNLFE